MLSKLTPSHLFKDSLIVAISIIALASSFFTITGISLANWDSISIWCRLALSLFCFIILFTIIYFWKKHQSCKQITIHIQNTPVIIKYGDIFNTEGLRVIGCDSHFDTRVDDIIISKNSLHGQLILNYSNVVDIHADIQNAAKKFNLKKNEKGLYKFPLGTLILHKSMKDNCIYLLLAMSQLDKSNKATTDSSTFIQTLMLMWKEIDCVYASRDIVMPLLGTGILRFSDGPRTKKEILECLLWTLRYSGVSLNSTVTILLSSKTDDISLYEYTKLFT